MEKEKTNLSNGRLLSIDALRGFDMLFIMGISGIIVSICSLFPGGEGCWLASQMGHVKWEGFQPPRHHLCPLSLHFRNDFSVFTRKKEREGRDSKTHCS